MIAVRRTGAPLAALALALAACGPPDRPGDGDGGPGGPPGEEFADAAPPEPCEKMDILFVIDDSGSMAEEQANLKANMPEFIRILDDFVTQGGSALDYRVAITTTGRDVDYTVSLMGFSFPFSEKGANGELLQKGSCGMTRRWIERGDANVATTFGCAAEVGTSGPGIEMPLYAIKLAFDDRIADGTNVGFLRDDALLAVVILTDEDDCSREDNDFVIEGTTDVCDETMTPEIQPVSRYIDFLDQLKIERGRWATAVIAGPGPGNCESAFGNAFEAKRLKRFVDDVGTNAVFSSICEGDLAGALQDALENFDAACAAFPPIQ